MMLAYIDPTTTSTLLYVLIGVAASVGYACRGFFYQLRDVLLSSKTGKTATDDELVFYSEGRQYWPVFEPVLRALDEKGVGYLYVSSGADDPGLKHTGEKVHTRYVSPNLTPAPLRQGGLGIDTRNLGISFGCIEFTLCDEAAKDMESTKFDPDDRRVSGLYPPEAWGAWGRKSVSASFWVPRALVGKPLQLKMKVGICHCEGEVPELSVAVIPKERGIGTDPRRLGVSFVQVELKSSVEGH